jgi:putative addiction module component (TIGR02574 family)
MKSNHEKVSKEALHLPIEARAALAGHLLESLNETVAEDVEVAWSKEIARRIDDIDQGKSRPFPGLWHDARSWDDPVAAAAIRLHPNAIAEARAAYEWYAERNLTAANFFIAELDSALVKSKPIRSVGPCTWMARGNFSSDVFPHAVIYRITDSVIQVIAVAHGRYCPGYWKRRRF